MPRPKDPSYTPSASRKLIDLSGARFGRWTVLSRAPGKGNARWNCRCDCGGERAVEGPSLRRGLSTSCGCISRTHGGFGTRLYRIWANMLNRCRNPNVAAYEHYGARGVSVCPEWAAFESFKAWAESNGYNADLTIERDDVNGDYCPSNCKWLPIRFQSANRRVVAKAPDGTPWYVIAAQHGISNGRFNARVSRGWTHQRAATTPLR